MAEREQFEAARAQGVFKPALECCPTWYATELRFEGWQAARTQPAPVTSVDVPRLTEEDLKLVYTEFMLYDDGLTPSGLTRVYRAIEAALLSKWSKT